MKGWILYKRNKQELTEADHGINRLLTVAVDLHIHLEVYKPEQFEFIVTHQRNKNILLNDAPVDLPDFLLPRLGAETSYFSLAIIRELEYAGVPTFNCSVAIEAVKDKMFLSQILAHHHLPTPKTMLVKFPVSITTVERELGFPLLIKNISGARGVGIHLCESALSFRDVIELIATHDVGHQQMLLQEFIANSYGRDLRVLVLGGKIIGCMQRTSRNSFKANYSLGGDVAPFPVTAEIARLAIDCAHLFNLEIAGIDLLFDKQGFTICEANSSPGFKGMEQAIGEDIASQLLKFIAKKVNTLTSHKK